MATTRSKEIGGGDRPHSNDRSVVPVNAGMPADNGPMTEVLPGQLGFSRVRSGVHAYGAELSALQTAYGGGEPDVG